MVLSQHATKYRFFFLLGFWIETLPQMEHCVLKVARRAGWAASRVEIGLWA